MISQIIIDLGQAFALKTLGEVSYFLGFEAKRVEMALCLTQTKYIHDLLAKTNMTNCKESPTPICLNQKLSLIVGHLSYLLIIAVLLGLSNS